MSNILHINASLFGDAGQSSIMANQFVSGWLTREPGTKVVHRDLGAEPVPHLTADVLQAAVTPADQRSPEQSELASLADRLIAELQEADVIVLGLPMYNFNVPSSLKAWFDHVARAGTTFRYTAEGPVGLLTGKRLYVFAARGGFYTDTGHDWQTPYIRDFFGLLGIDDIEFVYAEGLNIDEATRDKALATASTQIDRLAA